MTPTPLSHSFFSQCLSLLIIVCRRCWDCLHEGQINIIPLHTRACKMVLALHANTVVCQLVDLACIAPLFTCVKDCLDNQNEHTWKFQFAASKVQQQPVWCSSGQTHFCAPTFLTLTREKVSVKLLCWTLASSEDKNQKLQAHWAFLTVCSPHMVMDGWNHV